MITITTDIPIPIGELSLSSGTVLVNKPITRHTT
jgi:hypothetical protein